MKKYSIESVELHITDACTHRCPYCYADAKLTASEYANFDIIRKIVDELARSEVKVVALLGGDPVRHPRFVDIARYVKACGMKVACMSNTMVIEGHTPEQTLSFIDSIDTTIHGATADTHDAFCQSYGAYDSIMCYLETYSHLGVNVNIVINIIPQTYNKVYDIVKGVLSKGVIIDTLLTQRILPFGRAENSTEYDVVAKQVNIAFDQIEKAVSDFRIKASVEDPYPLCCVDEKHWKYMHGCPEGINRIAINLDGDVSRCGAVNDYSLGNILTTPLLQIWDSSTTLNSFRTCGHLTLPECLKCTYQGLCCGGCPVICEMCHKTGKNFIREFKGK